MRQKLAWTGYFLYKCSDCLWCKKEVERILKNFLKNRSNTGNCFTATGLATIMQASVELRIIGERSGFNVRKKHEKALILCNFQFVQSCLSMTRRLRFYSKPSFLRTVTCYLLAYPSSSSGCHLFHNSSVGSSTNPFSRSSSNLPLFRNSSNS